MQSETAWRRLSQLIAADEATAELDRAGRRAKHPKLLQLIETWTIAQTPVQVAETLQAHGIAAAPVLPINQVTALQHLLSRSAFYSIQRDYVGAQHQVGLPVTIEGKRYPMRGLAPFFGNDSKRLLLSLANVNEQEFDRLRDAGVVSLTPTQLRRK